MKAFFFAINLILVRATATTSLQDNLEAPASIEPNSTLDYLDRALNGLDNAFAFFLRSYKEVNLDAVIGTRIVEASLNVLLQRMEASGLISKVPAFVISRVKHIRDKACEVSDTTIPYIMQNEPEYYAIIGPILTKGLFELDYDSRNISKTAHIWPHSSDEAMVENESDSCIAELTGTKNGMTCAISNKCWKQMTNLGYSCYSLSHEIFYLEIAERFGCQLEMSWQINANKQGSLRRLQDIFCANMFYEANTIAEEGFIEASRDLFMEQAALCGMIGYRDFFSSRWLDNILSWQDSEDGCYKWSGWTAGRKFRFLQHRVKREEKRISSDCLCHRTAVAVSALAQYIRYILEVWLQEQY